MEDWQEVINVKDVARLYNDKKGSWLLLEVLKVGENGKAEEFKLIDYNKEKVNLYGLMEEDNWDWDKKYIFVYADPDTLCEF